MSNKEGKERIYIPLIMFDHNGYPMCEVHGAMNAVNKESTLYRCIECHIGIDMHNVFRYIERMVQKG